MTGCPAGSVISHSNANQRASVSEALGASRCGQAGGRPLSRFLASGETRVGRIEGLDVNGHVTLRSQVDLEDLRLDLFGAGYERRTKVEGVVGVVVGAAKEGDVIFLASRRHRRRARRD